MKFRGIEYKLNSLIEVIYENEEGYIVITMGRLYDYDNYKYIAVDYSEEFWELDNIVTIPIDKIKSIRKVNFDLLWR